VQTPNDPEALALSALAATLSDERRARRFIDLTGIGTDELRRRAGDPVLLAALIAFLEAHEPDLVSVAKEIGVEPAALAAIRQDLEGSR
jgi:uncharacterized protein DUF3572